MTTNNDEIRCYQDPRIIVRVIEIVALYPLLLLGAAAYNGHFLQVLWLPVLIFALLFLFWYTARWGTYILVNKNKKILQASNYFFRTKPILVESIVSIDTRSAFAGAATEIEISYVKPDGKKTVLGYGARNFLNSDDLRKILETLVDINPKLHIPLELRK
jgi:hypothetical protein